MAAFFLLLFVCVASLVAYCAGWEARGAVAGKVYWLGYSAGRKSEREEVAREAAAGAVRLRRTPRYFFVQGSRGLSHGRGRA